MSKRLTDINKWDGKWFRELSLEYKCLWMYICDKCDAAGVWEIDLVKAQFDLQTKNKFIVKELQGYFKNNIEIFKKEDKEFLLIKKFIPFQYKKGLNENFHPHIPVFNSISKYSLIVNEEKVYSKLTVNLHFQDIDKDMDKDKEEDKEGIVKGAINKNSIINKNMYGEFENVLLTKIEYDKLLDRYGEEQTAHWVETLSGYLESKGAKFRSHYATILNWHRREEKEHPERIIPKPRPQRVISESERKFEEEYAKLSPEEKKKREEHNRIGITKIMEQFRKKQNGHT